MLNHSYPALIKLGIAIILIFIMGVFGFNNLALAQQQQQQGGAPSMSNYDSALKGIERPFIGPAVAIVAAFLWIIRVVLDFLLWLITPIFEGALQINVSANPGSMEVVQIGWRALRDLANAMFLLLMVWIALTIVFSLENFGGKRLLFRVILIALLINFSLVIVTAIFSFSNYVAAMFYDKLPRDETGGLAVSSFIQQTLLLNTVDTPLTRAEAERLGTEMERIGEQGRFIVSKENLDSSKYALASALGVSGLTFQKTDAQLIQGFVGLLNVLTRITMQFPRAWRIIKTGAILYAVGAGVNLLVGDVYDIAKSLALINIYLLIIISSFVIVTMFLLVRLIALIVLAVLAPAAFFFFAVPGRYGGAFFQRWFNAVLRYAFFLPIFFFLFYLGLFAMDEYRKTYVVPLQQAGIKINVVAGGAPFFWVFLMSSGFLIASVWVSRRLAAEGAQIGESVVSRFGRMALGAATVGAAFGAGVLTRRFAPQLQEGIQKASQMPVVGKLAAPVLKRGEDYIEKQLRKADEVYAKVKERGTDQLIAGYMRSSFAHDKVGHIRAILERGKLDELEKRGVSVNEILTLMRRFGREEDILKRRLDLITPRAGQTRRQALEEMLNKFKAEDYAKLSANSLRDAAGNLDMDVISAITSHLEESHLSSIAKENREVRELINRSFAQNAALVSQLKPHTYKYVLSQPAQYLGYRLPAEARPPRGILEQLMTKRRKNQQLLENKIAELRSRAANLRRIGRNREAEKIEEVDIPELQNRLNRLIEGEE